MGMGEKAGSFDAPAPQFAVYTTSFFFSFLGRFPFPFYGQQSPNLGDSFTAIA